MSKFNVRNAPKVSPISVITTEATPSIKTHEGAPGYQRDARSELFLLAVSNMVGEDTFYEKATDRDARFKRLVQAVAVSHPQWTVDFLNWLRSDGNMRSASVVGALEAAAAMVKANIPGSRKMVASVLQRGDEPGEAMAYWLATYGRKMPQPVKRGIADGAVKLYTERSLLKYDTGSHSVRFADVIQFTHPDPKAPWQSDLFQLAMARRYGEAPKQESNQLVMVTNQQALRERIKANEGYIPSADELAAAGMTWEDTLSLLGSTVDKAKLWEAQIPSMGYMALLRNLRNFDEVGIAGAATRVVLNKLTDPGEVARSRQFPYRFLAAYEQVPSLRWGQALDEALTLSLRNLPELKGRSLVLIDTSASMTQKSFSAKSTMTPAKAAAVFGVALAMRNGADLFGFATHVFRHDVPKGASLIDQVKKFVARTGEVGHDTFIAHAVLSTFKAHDRVFIISDMQTMDANVTRMVPAHVPIYGFNLQGYAAAAMPTGSSNRHEFGGLTDSTFKMVPLLEAGANGVWPWEIEA